MPEYIERETLLERAEYDNNYRLIIPAEAIKDAPAADVAPVVHGRWIEKTAPARKIYFECSHCGAQENKHTAIKGHYCWRCGARMDGEEDGDK